MKRVIPFIVVILFSIANAIAQPTIEWQNSFGGTLKDGFSLGNIQQDQVDNTTDGGFIFTGFSHSNDGDVFGHHGLPSETDCWVVKLDSLGGIDWQKSLGGTNDEHGYSVRQTSDGGYILVSSTNSDDGDVTGVHYDSIGRVWDVWVVKLDAQANIVWANAYGGSDNDDGYSVIETYDGNYLVAGRTSSNDGDVSGLNGDGDIWLLKLDNSGNILWQKCLGGTFAETAYNVRETNDNGFIICGNTTSTDGDFSGTTSSFFGSVFLMKTDSVANIEWVQVYGGNLIEWGYHVVQTPDGGYAFGVNSGSSDLVNHHGSLDYWFLRLDNSGTILWENCYGGSDIDWFKSFQPLNDGGYVLVGEASSSDGDVTNNIGASDVWLVKIDSVGNIEWEKTYGGTQHDDATSVILTPDGGLLVAVESNSNDVDVSGHHGSLAESDCWIVKFSPVITGIEEEPDLIGGISITPMPVSHNSSINFELKSDTRINIGVYDLQGRRLTTLLDNHLKLGIHSIQLNIVDNNLSDGFYLIKFDLQEHTLTKKIIVRN